MQANAIYLAASLPTGRAYSLRQIAQRTALTPREVTAALLQLKHAGMVERQTYPRYAYRVIPALPGVEVR